jgi:hypothetical protein
MLMDSDTLLLALFLTLIFVGIVAWKLYDDFKHEIKGLRKYPPKRRIRR